MAKTPATKVHTCPERVDAVAPCREVGQTRWNTAPKCLEPRGRDRVWIVGTMSVSATTTGEQFAWFDLDVQPQK